MRPLLRSLILTSCLALASASPASSPKLPVSPALEIRIPAFTEKTLSNGLKVILLEDRELPLVSCSLTLPGGYSLDSAGKEGLASLCKSLLRDGGAGSRSPEKFDEAVDDRAASLWSNAETEEFSAGFSCLSEDLDGMLGLFSDMVLRPRFDKARLQSARLALLDYLSRVEDTPESAASVMQPRGYYYHHPYGQWATPASVASLTRAEVVSFYAHHYGPSGAVLVLSGSVDPAAALARLEKLFGSWKPQAALPAFPEVDLRGHRILFFPKEAAQASVRLILPGVKRNEPGEFPLRIANFVFGGGGFSSRLMSKIRSDKGLAYGVYAANDPQKIAGPYIINGSTRPDAVGDYLKLVFQIKEEYAAQGPTQAELDDAKTALVQEFAYRFTSPHGLANQKAFYTFNHYPADYIETYRARTKAVTLSQAKAEGRRIIGRKDWVLVVSGPASLKKVLEGYGKVTTLKSVLEPF